GAVKRGRVRGDGLVRVRDAGKVVAEIPGPALTDEAPLYNRPMQRPADLDRLRPIDPAALKPGPALREPRRAAPVAAAEREQALDLPAVRLDGAHQHAGARRLRDAGGPREGIGQG